MMKQRPNVTVNPNLPSPGKMWDIAWLQGRIPADEYADVQKGATSTTPSRRKLFGIQARNLKRLSDQARASCSALTATRRGRRTRRWRAMAMAGMTPMQVIAGLDGPRGRVPAVYRHRHASGRQERRPDRARCESAGQHHQHTADQCGLLPGPDGEPQRVSELAKGVPLYIPVMPSASWQYLLGALRAPRPLCGRGNEYEIRVQGGITG